MTETRTLDLDLTSMALREEAQEGFLATFYGKLVPYDTPTMIGGIEESFAREAFDPADVVGKPIAWRHGEPIGVFTAATNKDDGLYVTGGILDTVQGRDANVLLRAKAVTGLSVGFQPGKSVWNRAKTVVQHTAARMLEGSLTHMPAYATAGVSVVREETPMSETTAVETPVVPAEDPQAREALAQVRGELDQLRAAVDVAGSASIHPFAQFRSFGEYAQAVYRGDVEAREIVDQVTGDNPGVVPPQWMTQVKNIVDLGRPSITAIGVESAGASGMDFHWPYLDPALDLADIVAAQLTEKSEVNSVAIKLLKGTASLATYAAASDISYQLLQRSAPSYLDAHNRVMAASYALVTNSVFAGDLVTASTALNYDFASDTDGLAFRSAVFGASVAVEAATGAPASVVICASNVFTAIGSWETFFPAPYSVQNVGGTATASTLAVSVSGLPVIHDRSLADGTILVTNRSAAAWIEDGPRLATAETPTKLGRDVAVYGYGCSAIYNAAGIVSLEVVAGP